MSAFDWSPGGCCCTPGFFECLSFQNPNAGGQGRNNGKFVRMATMFPPSVAGVPGGLGLNTNETTPQWIIEPALGIKSHGATHAGGNIVWSFNSTGSPSTPPRFCCYDIVAKLELLSSAEAAQTAQTTIPNATANRTQYVYRKQNGDVVILNSNGTSETWTHPSLVKFDDSGSTFPADPNGVSIDRREEIVVAAKLDWPHAAVLTTTETDQRHPSSSPTITYEVEFAHGTLANGTLNFSVSKNTIRTVTYDHSTVTGIHSRIGFLPLGYDYFEGHWCAAIGYDTTIIAPNNGSGWHNRVAIIVDGQEVFALTDVAVQTGGQFSFTARPHVCYPHETLGDGYVAVYQNVTPTTSAMVMYKDGAEVWRSPYLTDIIGSTDRWVYFQGQGKASVVTNGEFRYPGNPEPATGSAYWIARHDGSQIIPLGILTDTFGEIIGVPLNNGHPAGFNTNSFVRDSALVNSLPATYAEMYAGRVF